MAKRENKQNQQMLAVKSSFINELVVMRYIDTFPLLYKFDELQFGNKCLQSQNVDVA